jgi:hypothetical protein
VTLEEAPRTLKGALLWLLAPSNVRFRGAKQTWLKDGVMSAYDRCC